MKILAARDRVVVGPAGQHDHRHGSEFRIWQPLHHPETFDIWQAEIEDEQIWLQFTDLEHRVDSIINRFHCKAEMAAAKL
jgi:hypothetical protein